MRQNTRERTFLITHLNKNADLAVLRSVVAMMAILMTSSMASAGKKFDAWTPLYHGIDHARGISDGSDGRPQIVTAIRVDLTASGLSFTSTPGNGRAPLDTLSETTSEFLDRTAAQVAINTSFYSPCCSGSPQNKDIIGLAITDGVQVSPAQSEARAALLLSLLNTAEFVNTVSDSFSTDNIDTAFSGSNFVLGIGRDLPSSADAIHPARTLVGLGDRDSLGDNRLLYLLTIDDGLPGVSEGATRRESAEWLLRAGAHTGANLDGGGSTLLAMRDPPSGQIERLNAKVGGERSNANHLGIFASPLSAPASPQFAPLWFAGLPDNSVADFSAEDAMENTSPGSPTGLDDDYYFTGTYADPIGVVSVDEPLGNLERALIAFDPPNDRQLRFHFNLTEQEAASNTTFRYLTAAFQQDGGGSKSALIELRFNGEITDAFSLGEGEEFMSVEFSANRVMAQPGANVLSLSLVGGDAQWTNLDFHRLDIRIVPEPSSAIPALICLVLVFAVHREIERVV